MTDSIRSDEAVRSQPKPARDIGGESALVLPKVQSLVLGGALVAGLSEKAAAHVNVGLQERTDFGRAKYGDDLTTYNGRRALVDAYQEILDFIQYMTQVYMENPQFFTDRERAVYNMLNRGILIAIEMRVLLNDLNADPTTTATSH